MVNIYYLIAAAAIGFVIVFAVIFLVLGGSSAETARLAEVTGAGAELPSSRLLGKGAGGKGLSADKIADLLGPISGLIGTRDDSDLVRRLAAAGYRKSSHAQIYG